MKPKRHGLATILAVCSIAMVGAAGTAVAVHLHNHATRCATEIEAAQLRQLLTAATLSPVRTGQMPLPDTVRGYRVDEVKSGGGTKIVVTGPTRRLVEQR